MVIQEQVLFRESKIDSQLIFKYPYNNPLFREYNALLQWPFSNTILITSYSLLRDDHLVQELQRTGATLREKLQDFGFNRKIKILADTGIFEIEARKANVDIPLDPAMDLSVNDIFTSYDLIDPDFLVAPDEIILTGDNDRVAEGKMIETMNNLDLTMDRFPSDMIIATIQGVKYEQVDRMVDHIADLGLEKVARGGLLPMRRSNRRLYERMLGYTEKKVRKSGIKHLHAFGLPGAALGMPDFFVKNSYDSVDTSMIYHQSADRKYMLERGQMVSVRRAFFRDCDCLGCKMMRDSRKYPQSGKFMVGLYYHNAYRASEIAKTLLINPKFLEQADKEYHHSDRFKKRRKWIKHGDFSVQLGSRLSDVLMPASKVRENRLSINFTDPLKYRQKVLWRLSELFEEGTSERRVLVISSCSNWKSVSAPDQPGFDELDTPAKRLLIKDKFYDLLIPARDLYLGMQNRAVNRSLYFLRRILGEGMVDHRILSAGFGLVSENEFLPPYDSTFSNLGDYEIDDMSRALNIDDSIRRLGEYDMIYLALGDSYLKAMDLSLLRGREIVYFGSPEYEQGISLEIPFVNYAVDEFFDLERSFKKPLGENYYARGSILENYALNLFDRYSRPEDISFTKFWSYYYHRSRSRYFYNPVRKR